MTIFHLRQRLLAGGFLYGVAGALIVVVPANAAETISGLPKVVDATTMIIDNRAVQLDHIISLKPGFKCIWKNRPLDCGVLATAGLKDLVAGASKVNCEKNASKKYTCTAGGYDLAFGLIHAGWAIPDSKAPAHYVKKMNRAKKRKLGFWGATTPSQDIVAATLAGNH